MGSRIPGKVESAALLPERLPYFSLSLSENQIGSLPFKKAVSATPVAVSYFSSVRKWRRNLAAFPLSPKKSPIKSAPEFPLNLFRSFLLIYFTQNSVSPPSARQRDSFFLPSRCVFFFRLLGPDHFSWKNTWFSHRPPPPAVKIGDS